jgi:methionyl-tRNA formyltransferase
LGIKELRVVFAGMSRFFTRPVLRSVAAQCSLVGIIEAAPATYAPRHGGKNRWSSHLQAFARHRGTPYFLLRRGGERAVDFLRGLEPDVVCVAGSEQLLRRQEFEIPRLGAINLHPSLLPKYRGPLPYFWQSYEMDLDGGITIHQIDQGIDTGDILIQARFPIRLGASFLEIFQDSLTIGSDAMIHSLKLLATGQIQRRSQSQLSCPRYARFVAAGEELVDWQSWPIHRVWHFLRSTHDQHPFLPVDPGSRWSIGQMVSSRAAVPPGTIARDERGYFIAHGEGKIRLTLHRRPGSAHRLLLPVAQRIRRTIEWW